MKNKAFLTGICGLALIFGIVLLVGCKEDEPDSTQYTVNFSSGDSGAGQAPASKTVEEGKSIALPAAPSAPTGKEFTGWKADTTGVIYLEGANYVVNESTIFTAQWKATAPAAPTERQVHVRNFNQQNQNDVIAGIKIYKHDAQKANGQGDTYKTYVTTVKYGDTWEGGRIADEGKYVVEVTIGGTYFTARAEIDVFRVTDPSIILSFDGTAGLAKQ
jgi:hypothetical protein